MIGEDYLVVGVLGVLEIEGGVGVVVVMGLAGVLATGVTLEEYPPLNIKYDSATRTAPTPMTTIGLTPNHRLSILSEF